MKTNLRSILILSLAAPLLSGCPDQKEKSADAPSDLAPLTVEAAPVSEEIESGVSVQGDRVQISIRDVPAGVQLACRLNGGDAEPCQDGDVWASPGPGEHRLTVLALENGRVRAIGSSLFRVMDPSRPQGVDKDDPMRVTIGGVEDGATVRAGQALAVNFSMRSDLGCEASLECRLGGAPYMTCPQTLSVPGQIVPTGRFTIAARLSCGDKVGFESSVTVWGVGQDHKELDLQRVTDDTGRHVVALVNASECSVTKLSFECTGSPNAPGDGFAPCNDGPLLTSPSPGTRVRAVCGLAMGRPLTLP